MNIDQASLNNLVAKRSAHSVNTDTTPALQVRYTGAYAYAHFEISCGTSDTRIIGLVSDSGAPSAGDFDTNFGSAGQIKISSTAYTLGTLADAIHGYTGWECVILHGKESEQINVSASDVCIFSDVSADVTSTAGVKVYYDTDVFAKGVLSVSKELTAFADYAKGEMPSNRASVDSGFVHSVISGDFKATFSDGTTTIKVYDGDTEIYQLSGGATATEKTFWQYNDFPVGAEKGNRLTVEYASSCTTPVSAAFTAVSGGIKYQSAEL